MPVPTAFEQARDRWREHALHCLHCGFDRQCPTGEGLNEQWKAAARANYEARRNAGPVAAYLREFERIAVETAQPATRSAEVTPEPRPAADWTDDEWLAAMAQFPPDAPITEVESWISLVHAHHRATPVAGTGVDGQYVLHRRGELRVGLGRNRPAPP